MPSFWKHVNLVLQSAQIIIEVLDARMVDETRNKEIEEKVKKNKKRIIYVLNKCDLVDKKELEVYKKSLKPCIFVSSREHLGTTMLKKKILEISRGQQVTVGIVGYPNVGKSSLINALAGKGKTKTSAESGFTKGIQKIKVDNKIYLLDTPGVFPDMEKNVKKHAKIGAIDYGKIKDPETAVLKIIQEEKESVLKYYKIQGNDPEEIIETIAIKLHRLIKGGEADIETTSRLILKDWQAGKIE